jgi:hypothetical protein
MADLRSIDDRNSATGVKRWSYDVGGQVLGSPRPLSSAAR